MPPGVVQPQSELSLSVRGVLKEDLWLTHDEVFLKARMMKPKKGLEKMVD